MQSYLLSFPQVFMDSDVPNELPQTTKKFETKVNNNKFQLTALDRKGLNNSLISLHETANILLYF